MEYTVKNGSVDVKQDKKLLVKRTIMEFCEDFNRIPSIEEYNRYKTHDFTINEFLHENKLVYSHLIYNVFALKQTKKGVIHVNWLTLQFEKWLDQYQKSHGELPPYRTAESVVREITADASFGREMQKFLKQFGIKPGKKRHSIHHYECNTDDEILEEAKKILAEIKKSSTAYVMIAEANKRHVLKRRPQFTV